MSVIVLSLVWGDTKFMRVNTTLKLFLSFSSEFMLYIANFYFILNEERLFSGILTIIYRAVG